MVPPTISVSIRETRANWWWVHMAKTILIVDDESNMRFLIRITLENAGYQAQ